MVQWDSKVHYLASYLSLGLLVWLRLGDLFLFKNPRKFCASHSPRRILVCACTTFSSGQIQLIFFCANPIGLLSSPSHILSFTLFVLICCSRLSYECPFRLCHHITYIYYFVVPCLFLLWYNWSLQHCFILVLENFSVCLWRFTFHSRVKAFSCEISLVCCLRCQHNSFSPIFVF